ncbi:MAG: hypothetical protein P9L96_06640 [Candidatus Gygaella obscura]|nr:hypothetical protein [Candidatus Gygaella obscura]
MNKSGKITGIIFILLIVILVSAAGYLFFQWQQEKQRGDALQVKVLSLETEKKALVSKYRITLVKLEELDVQLKEKDLKAQALEENLRSAEELRKKAIEDVNAIHQQMAEAEKAKKELEIQLNQTKEELDSLKSKMNVIHESSKVETQEQIYSSAEDVDLEKIVVSSNESLQAKDARVLVVNKEYDFVVLNLGKHDDIAIGDIVQVIRGDAIIGSLEVEEVRETMSVARFSTEGLKEQIKEGDLLAL